MSPPRLDKTLFWLRWLLLIGVALPGPLTDTAYDADGLLAGLVIGVAGNLLLGVLILVPRVGGRLLGPGAALLDSLLAAMFFWVYAGATLPLLVFGAVALLAATFRFGRRGLVAVFSLLSLLGLSALGLLDNPSDTTLANGALSLALLGVMGVFGVVLRSDEPVSGHSDTLAERRIEALKLRSARERASAIFEMANTLSATLDHRRVLEAAQTIGSLALREDLGEEVRLFSAVLLFQGKDNLLRVVSSRGLTRADETTAVPGRRGVLGLALKGAEPVFAGDGNQDPELRYFVAFQEAKSVLAIPLRAGFDVYGVMVFGSDQANAFSDEHVELMTAIGTQSTMALQNAVLYQDLLEEKERIVEVEEDARKKLARDLHDGPTQTVAAIAMRVNYIRRLIERQPQQAIEELWKVEDLARRTTKEIRHMLFTLRPLVLENQGLLAALRQLADKMRDTYDTTVIVEGKPDVEVYLDINGQGVIFYIVEEAVNNARKHAQSQHIWVRLAARGAFVVVEIEDDGVGFDVEAVDAGYDRRGSLGMVNMRERAELIEGALRIESKLGEGTKISVLVPIHPAAGPQAVADEEPAPPLDLTARRTPSTSPDFLVAEKAAPAAPPVAPPDPASSPPKKPATGPLKPLPSQARPSQPKKPATGPLSARDSAPKKPATGPLKRLPSQPKKPATGPLGASDSTPKKPATGPLKRLPSQPKKPTTGPLGASDSAPKKPATGPLPAPDKPPASKQAEPSPEKPSSGDESAP